jgi:2-iminobutanoate/2-iminopropanoate deaminase
LIFVSGHTGRTKEGTAVKGDVKAQTRQTFENINHVLEAPGATLKDVVKMTTFLTTREDYAAFNEVRREYFEDAFPASSTVIIRDLVGEGRGDRCTLRIPSLF